MGAKTQFGNKIKRLVGNMDLPPGTPGKGENLIYFARTVTVTPTLAATPVSIIADSEVPRGYAPFVTDMWVRVNGATAWTTAATFKIQDTNGTPVDFFTIAIAGLTGNAYLRENTANVTADLAHALMTGGTAGKGLQTRANANAGAGSPTVVTIEGFYRKLTGD